MIPLVIAILSTGVVIVVVYYCIPWIYKRWSQRVLRQRVTGNAEVVVTLDDGPGSALTPAVLQILADNGKKATFFLLGRNIQGNEGLVRRIHAQGHEIGSHSYDHLHAWKAAPWRCISDIKRGQNAIDDALGVSGGTYAFRPPYGKLNIVTLVYLLAKRIPIVFWTIDSGDTWAKRPHSEQWAADLCRANRGGVVLIHDFDRSADDVYPYSLAVLQSVLTMAHEMHLSVLLSSQIRAK